RVWGASVQELAGDVEDEQRVVTRKVGPDVKPVQEYPCDGRADEETRLHREREPSHRSAESAALHRFRDRREQRRLLGAPAEPADDLPDEQREDRRRGGGREL